MRFFSKIVALCNLCFILAVIVRYLQFSDKTHADYRGIEMLHPIESTLVILGYGAILLNFIMTSLLLFYFMTKASHKISTFILLFNFLFLFIEVYYFFFSEF